MDEMYEIVHQTTHRFLGIKEVYKLMMDEMDETGKPIAKFGYETRVVVVVLVVSVVFDWLFGMYDSKNWVVYVIIEV